MVHPSVSGGYAYYNGTSMAAPHVAGVVALWLAEDPTLTPKAIVDELKASALSRSSTQCPRKCGPGLLNADRKQAAEAVTVAIRVRSFHVAGGAAHIVAHVRANGRPQAGRTVSFTSATSVEAKKYSRQRPASNAILSTVQEPTLDQTYLRLAPSCPSRASMNLFWIQARVFRQRINPIRSRPKTVRNGLGLSKARPPIMSRFA